MILNRRSTTDDLNFPPATVQVMWEAFPSHPLDIFMSLQWRYNEHGGISNHQPHGCFLNRLFRRRSKETSKLRVTGLCMGNSPGPVNSPHKGPVTRKMFPFDDVIMNRASYVGSVSISSSRYFHVSNTDPKSTGLILGFQPANEGRRYKVTLSLIG